MVFSVTAASAGQFGVEGLLTGFLKDPLGIDERHPGFSWRMVSDARCASQSAYQVQVASSESLLAEGKPDMWDSGKVASSASVDIRYAGKRLVSRTRCYWHVRIWDGAAKPSAFSKPASFEMALLDPKDWKARWVTVSDGGGGNGYHSEFADTVDTVKWVRIDLGKKRDFTTVILYPAHPYNWKHDVIDFGFPVRYRIEASDEPEFRAPRVIADLTGADQVVPHQIIPVTVPVGEQSARYVRIVVTRLQHPKDTQPLFALAEIEILDARSRNIAANAPVTALDSIEHSGWGKDRLTDGARVSREPGGTSPMLRREFVLDKPIRCARVYVTGLGYHELRLNGKRVGDRVLSPSYTNFGKRIYYNTYDVTRMLKRGANAFGALFGQGWWRKPPHFICQLEVTYKDGTQASVLSDDKWRWSTSPILENSIYNGETYDARLEQPGWDCPGFDDSSWGKVNTTEMPAVTLSAEMIQPIKIVQTIAPRAIKSPKPGVYVVDFGQNFSGWCRIAVSGKAGDQVRLRFAETLYPDGTVNQENLRSAKATDTYILRGEGTETYQPRFTYHGFRYAQIEGLPGTPDYRSVVGCVVHTSFRSIGDFACSNRLINDIQRASVWGERTNFHSIPTDCPQRDERQGWTGDAHMSAYAMLYNLDMPAPYSKFLRDIQDAQGEDGSVPDTVPHVWGAQNGDPMWSIVYPLVLWETYLHTGDRGLLAQHYEGIKRYAELLRREAGESRIITRNCYGDWIGVTGTPGDLISTGSFVQVSGLLARMAGALGKENDAREYTGLRAKVAQAFNARFFDAKTGSYGNGSQFSNAFPLWLGIVPSEHHDAVLESLLRDIDKRNGHLSSGFIGTPYLMATLLREGRADVAYTVATREDYPGWGFMIANGATTIWELWELKVGNGMNSHNHPALGFVSGWFYEALAGIRPDSSSPGWERFTVAPKPVGNLKWARGALDTVRGRVASRWRLTKRGIDVWVSVPANSRADVFIPKLGRKEFRIEESGVTIWRGGRLAEDVTGVTGAEDDGDCLRFEVCSGQYAFSLGD